MKASSECRDTEIVEGYDDKEKSSTFSSHGPAEVTFYFGREDERDIASVFCVRSQNKDCKGRSLFIIKVVRRFFVSSVDEF